MRVVCPECGEIIHTWRIVKTVTREASDQGPAHFVMIGDDLWLVHRCDLKPAAVPPKVAS